MALSRVLLTEPLGPGEEALEASGQESNDYDIVNNYRIDKINNREGRKIKVLISIVRKREKSKLWY